MRLNLLRVGVLGAVALAGVSVLAQVPAPTGDDARFRSGVDLVNVTATVTDELGRFVPGLTERDFRVFEDGEAQSITNSSNQRVPVSLGILLDTSGSMSDDIGLARSAAVRFLNTFPDAQDMALVEFATEVRIARYGQRDFPRLVERIRARRPEGEVRLAYTVNPRSKQYHWAGAARVFPHAIEPLLERLAGDELHHQVVRPDVVKRADVRMVERGQESRLARETRPRHVGCRPG